MRQSLYSSLFWGKKSNVEKKYLLLIKKTKNLHITQFFHDADHQIEPSCLSVLAQEPHLTPTQFLALL